MHKLIVQVNMGTVSRPIWNNLNSYAFDFSIASRQWSSASQSYIECMKSARNLCTKAIGSWANYHRYFSRQFRIVHDSYREQRVLVTTGASES